MDGIDWASSAMAAARTRLDIATGNLANVSTDGFVRLVAHGRLTANGVEIHADFGSDRGALRHTGRAFDLAIVGNGAFAVRDRTGTISHTRDGSFMRDREGHLRDRHGYLVLGTRGPLTVPPNATIDARGRVLDGDREVDRLPLPAGSSVRAGFLESADVNAIGEMVDVLTAQRSFESAEKVVAAIDTTREKSADDVARVK